MRLACSHQMLANTTIGTLPNRYTGTRRRCQPATIRPSNARGVMASVRATARALSARAAREVGALALSADGRMGCWFGTVAPIFDAR